MLKNCLALIFMFVLSKKKHLHEYDQITFRQLNGEVLNFEAYA